MNLDDAIKQVEVMRSMAGRSQSFRGFRWRPIFATALTAAGLSATQPIWLRRFADPDLGYVIGWTAAAVLCVAMVLTEMLCRYARDASLRERRLTWAVMSRLLPALSVGAGCTLVIAKQHPALIWLLPSLWCLLLGVGIAAASSHLPHPLERIAIWYIACGFAILILLPPTVHQHPTVMGVCFGGGQGLTAWLVSRQS